MASVWKACGPKAEGDLGNYLPRLTRGYGNSQGANEIWWIPAPTGTTTTRKPCSSA